MSASTSRSETALDFIRNMKDFRQDIDIEYTIQILTKDLKGDNIGSFSNYLDEIVSVFPPKQLAEFISKLAKITRPIEVANKIAIFLLNHARPLFQIQGVFMVENLGDEGFIPLVVKHIYSTHKPLQKKAIKLVINLQGNAEEILESHIKSKSERKRKIAYRVLRCLNPDNIKLCFEALESEDFIVRSEAIKKIGNTKRKKYLKKLKPFLDDKDMAVKKAAIEAIALLGGRDAKKTLYHFMVLEEHQALKNLVQKAIDTMD